MTLERILILDDDPTVLTSLRNLLARKLYTVFTADSMAGAADLMAKESFDLMLLDVRLPDGDGHELLEHVSLMSARPLVVMMTGHGTIDHAVSCMKAGAFDYIVKPFSLDQVDLILRKAESSLQLLRVNSYLSSHNGDDGEIIGENPTMKRLLQLARRVARTDTTVLITGENGTGKEMIARELYRHSSRRTGPYIKVNCAALSESLIESELFGHEKGAFTGATARRQGRFELAHQGTLLLDEISEISSNLQAKLLRILQEKEFERVGGSRTIKVNVRVIATSNRNIEESVRKGDFRSDLYYRLNVFSLHIPALRERPEDIIPLAENFLRRFSRKHRMRLEGFSDHAIATLLAYRWPGNVRELQNTIERAVILSEGRTRVPSVALGLDSLLGSMGGGARADDESSAASVPMIAEPEDAQRRLAPPREIPELEETEEQDIQEEMMPEPSPSHRILPLQELEKQAILNALQITGDNRTKAAELLGISIRTLRNKLREYRDAAELVLPET